MLGVLGQIELLPVDSNDSDANTDVCRIVASVFRIFVDEVHGYQTKLLVMDEKNLTFDFSSQFSRLSTCRDPL